MTVRIINADVMDGLAQLDDESVHCVVTSPPYFWLRDYGVAGQIGHEPSLWHIDHERSVDGHSAAFPEELVERCLAASTNAGGVVLDPFAGSGTTGLVADRLKRNAILIELNPEYAAMAERRVKGDCPMFAEVSA